MNKSKNICVLGVTGSIAAYKAADLTSKLVQAGIQIQVIMTENAGHFIGAQTFRTLSQRPVIQNLWDVPDWKPEHIALAECASLLVIMPATANFIAKMAHGIADDALSTYYLSHTGNTIVVPAMNPRMWKHPATRENCRILQERQVQFVGPIKGHVACDDKEPGEGRMASMEAIQKAVMTQLQVQ
ncbi:MAG: flavoprotein [Lentisphaeria bacterium]